MKYLETLVSLTHNNKTTVMDKETYLIEYLDYNRQYQLRKVKSWYGDQGAVNRLPDCNKIISINGEVFNDFSHHKQLCPICNPQ